MRISIMALGSRGDVLPYVTLGKALKDTGHQVLVATYNNFEPIVTSLGLDFHQVRGDARSMLQSAGGISLSESGRNPFRLFRSIMKSFGSLAEGYARDFSSPIFRESNLIINQLPGGLYGYDLSEKFEIPMVMAAVIPLTRTQAFPMVAFPSNLSWIPGYNLLSYRIAEQLVWIGFRRVINNWRQVSLGLLKNTFWGHFSQLNSRKIPVINGFSEQVIPRPIDWGENVYITGYWFPEEEDWQPPEMLERFIDSGPPPVYIGFGSMPIRDPQKTTSIILETIRKIGVRAVIHGGWAGLGKTDLPKNVHYIDYVPFHWLFPRMAAIVHHGGSGTTAYGLRYGKPSVIVPFLFDQYFWGKRVHQLGAGPKPIRFNKLTADSLSGAMDIAISDPQIQSQASKLGERIRNENGLTSAVNILEQIQNAH